MMDLKEYLQNKTVQIDRSLLALLPPSSAYPEIIHESVSYSIFAGGKRLRPILCLAGAEALGGDSSELLPVACALEMIHTYSLVHDDLPAMDDDDYRRGKPTNHKVFGEGIAVLAGDALLTLAFEVLAAYGMRVKEEKRSQVLAVIQEIARAAGAFGMIGGQAVDLQSEGKKIESATLEYIHRHKTGALFTAAVRAGALLSQATEHQLAALSRYAENFGLAFQITDDLLDIEGSAEVIGKPVGSDIRNEKVTYPSLYGLENTKRLAAETIEKAVEALSDLPGDAEPLRLLVQYLLKRDR
ncbi:MAG: polyprenyl synthetase family protein [Clostridia bacterium]|jgi:geranylgeranyl diphosphate synthase type II|nr:polyprenyl synthetase family protein [Clostridia bacterium]